MIRTLIYRNLLFHILERIPLSIVGVTPGARDSSSFRPAHTGDGEGPRRPPTGIGMT